MHILTLNAGSSTLKFALFKEGSPPVRVLGQTLEVAASDTSRDTSPVDAVLERLAPFGGLEQVTAVGHRIVHGGPSFQRPTRIDDPMLAELRKLSALDPDHLPAEIAMVEAVRRAAPETPQIACFDTAFHATMPRVARLLPLPSSYEAQGVRRYGFHGLSCEYLVGELERVAGKAAARGRLVIAHLGSGSSLTAVRDGHSIDTTMSFTPNSGVPMATRSGDLDPGVLIHLARTEKTSLDALDEMLNKRSGLLGVSGAGGSADMRELLRRESSHEGSAIAVALFCHWARKAIGALATTLDGIDTLIFSAGIGEKAAVVRARICSGLRHLGVTVDAAQNDANAPLISTDGSPCAVRVIPTDEEAVIARETHRLTRGG
jgi:acetate kinase